MYWVSVNGFISVAKIGKIMLMLKREEEG
jgi:hypothetical protein